MTPRDYQNLGDKIGMGLQFAFGIFALFPPKKLLGGDGSEAEIAKRVKICRICAACLLLGTLLQVVVD